MFLSNYTQFRLNFLVIYISKPLHRTSHLHFPNIYSIFFGKTFILFLHCSYIFFFIQHYKFYQILLYSV